MAGLQPRSPDEPQPALFRVSSHKTSPQAAGAVAAAPLLALCRRSAAKPPEAGQAGLSLGRGRPAGHGRPDGSLSASGRLRTPQGPSGYLRTPQGAPPARRPPQPPHGPLRAHPPRPVPPLTAMTTVSSPWNLAMYLSPRVTSDSLRGLKRHITLMLHSAGSAILGRRRPRGAQLRSAPLPSCPPLTPPSSFHRRPSGSGRGLSRQLRRRQARVRPC